MSYVYDLVLNFNGDLMDFYEWKKDDSLCHIKRINIIKVDSNTYNDFYNNINESDYQSRLAGFLAERISNIFYLKNFKKIKSFQYHYNN